MKMKTIVLALLVSFTLFAQPGSQVQLSNPVPTAPAVSASVVGNPGITPYSYFVVVNYGGGAVISAPAFVSNAPNTLSGTAYVNIGWNKLQGALTYDVIRLAPGVPFSETCTCAVATGLTSTDATDTGSALASYTMGTPAVAVNGTIYANNRDDLPPAVRQILNGVDLPVTDLASVARWGVVADYTGTSGTDQTAKIQRAVMAASALSGAMPATVTFPAAPLAYGVSGTVYVPSNVTINLQPGAVVMKTAAISSNGPVFQTGDSTASTAVSNIWFVGGGAIDGNNANISFTGDGENMGIRFAGCTECGTKGITVRNAATGNIYITCWGPSITGVGNHVQILDTTITASRRNNFELICGVNTVMRGGSLTNATGGSLSLGLDVEPNGSGQLVAGLLMDTVSITGNRDGCINYKLPYDPAGWTGNFQNITCTVPVDTSQAVSIQNANTGTVNISDSSITSGSSASSAVNAFGGAAVNITNTKIQGSQRALLTCSNCGASPGAAQTTIVGSVLSGSVHDIDCLNPVLLVGLLTLANGTKGTACAEYVTTTSQEVANGFATLGTSAIASAACAAVVSRNAIGAVASTDVLEWSFTADPTGTTGYAPTSSGSLKVVGYVTADLANFKVCNDTSASITPGAAGLHWSVIR
jgi:hypothetical protein